MESSTRLGLAAVALAVVWIAVYWMTPPRQTEPSVARQADPMSQRPIAGDPQRELTMGDAWSDRAPPLIVDPLISDPLLGDADDADADADAEVAGAVVVDPPDASGIVPPAYRWYTIRRGDTPDSISRRFFGTTRHRGAIMRMNPQVDFQRRVRVGLRIKVPVDPENVQGLAADEQAEQQRDNATPDVQFMEYTVKRGESLSQIAQKVYGRSSLWRLILDANRDQLRRNDGTDLRAGMVLKLPPKPAD